MKREYRNISDVFVGRLHELVHDNKGAALAITLAFVMPVYLMVIGIYGIGEMVRNKIELQNAADAAAYSAAVVQADYLSRMATVNKAMAWTYVDLQKRSLDLAMAIFTFKTILQFKKDSNMVVKRNKPCHMHVPGVNYNCGTTFFAPGWLLNVTGAGAGLPAVAKAFNGQNMLNRMLLVHVGVEAYAEVRGKGVIANTAKVASYSWGLVKMMKHLVQLQDEYPKKIREAAMQVAVANMVECKDEYILNIRVEDMPKLSLLPTESNEKTFISWADPGMKETDPKKVFGPGTDDWIVRGKIPAGFSRVYKQTEDHLYANWQWFWTKWVHVQILHVSLHLPPVTPTGAYQTGERKFYGKDFTVIKEGMPIGLVVAPAIPLTLRPDYCGKGGSIVVAIARKSANPFAAFNLFGQRSLTASGIASAFNPSVAGGSRPEYMCAIATARAGYKPYYEDKEEKRKSAFYAIGYDILASGKESWNLVETDWDAVMVPVRNAWDLCGGSARLQMFTVSSGNILKEIMLDKKGWVDPKGKKIDAKNLPDWEKLAPPPGLIKDEKDKKSKESQKNRLQWDKLRDYLGH